MSVWGQLKESRGVSIENPSAGSQDCDARCFPVSIQGQIDAAIVLPGVADYSMDQIEIIAAIGVREALGVDDGDSLILEIKPEKKGDNS